MRRRALLMATGALVLGACTKTLEWTEDVQLQNGDVIVVKRTAKLVANFVAGGGGGSFNKGMTVQIVSPIKPDNPPRWDARFVPVIFDRDSDTKEWFVVATFYHCDSWVELGRPKLPYTEYRLRDGQWKQQVLSPKFIGRAGNMLTHIRANGQTNQTLTTKAGEMASPGIDKTYLFVMGTWSNNC